MGIFDLFKKKKSKIPNMEIEQLQKRIPEVKYDYSKDGNFAMNFYDAEPALAQAYDNTRLVINPIPLNFANEKVYECNVIWYIDDSCYSESDTEPRAVTIDKQRILMQIDLPLARMDQQYAYLIMKNFLNHNRIIKYIEGGLQDNPELPCGNYVGGVRQNETTGEYKEFFSNKVGKAVHNSPQMVACRNKHKRKLQESAKKINSISQTPPEKSNEINR